jgi:hypothetical protein
MAVMTQSPYGGAGRQNMTLAQMYAQTPGAVRRPGYTWNGRLIPKASQPVGGYAPMAEPTLPSVAQSNYPAMPEPTLPPTPSDGGPVYKPMPEPTLPPNWTPTTPPPTPPISPGAGMNPYQTDQMVSPGYQGYKKPKPATKYQPGVGWMTPESTRRAY